MTFGLRMLDDRSSGGSFAMSEYMILTVRERTTECRGVPSKVGFDRIIRVLFKWLSRHGSRFPDGAECAKGEYILPAPGQRHDTGQRRGGRDRIEKSF